MAESRATSRHRRQLAAAALVSALGACITHAREQAGHFEIRSAREDFGGHSHTTMSLVYHGRTLADGLTDWTVDRRRPDRIVYASTTPCGTFFLDAATQRRLVLAPAPIIVHAAEDDSPEFAGSNPWSSDGRYVWIGNDIANPIVVDLDRGERIDLPFTRRSNSRLAGVRWSDRAGTFRTDHAPPIDGSRAEHATVSSATATGARAFKNRPHPPGPPVERSDVWASIRPARAT
ncbi:MAG: hypothetical protein DMD73_05510 [Gemmatimonadetes bacterium]|nr:MAG: hypothetical protein DMD73_05510 [Gemmatimonadota bacterium]